MRQIDRQAQYKEAQKLFEEYKRLMGTEGNDARINECKYKIWLNLEEIISGLYEKDGIDKLRKGTEDIDIIGYILEKYNPDKGSLVYFVESVYNKKVRYEEAQKLFEECKRLMGIEGNDARINKCKRKILYILMEIIYGLYKKDGISKESIQETSEKDIEMTKYILEKYDPDKRNLKYFIKFVYGKKKNLTKQEQEDIANRKRKLESMDAPIEESDITLEDIVPGFYEEYDPQAVWNLKDKLADMITVMNDINQLHLNTHLKKDAGMKLVFTDKMTDVCKNEPDLISIPDVLRKQKSILNGMDMDFLDFYMSAKCRSLGAIRDTNLKEWKDIPFSVDIFHERNPLARPDVPLPNNVYKSFLFWKDTSRVPSGIESSVSQYKRGVPNFLKDLGLKNLVSAVGSFQKTHGMEETLTRKILIESPLRNIIVGYFREIPKVDWKNPEVVQKGLSLRIDEVMYDNCVKIKERYEALKDEESEMIEKKKKALAKAEIDSFIQDWKNNFFEKSSYVKNFIKDKETRKYAPDYIREMALTEIRKNITQEEQGVEMVLKSLDDEFTRGVQSTNSVIYIKIERNATESAKKETISKIAEEENISQNLVGDVIRALEDSDAESIEKIIEKVQNDHLYSYYWT